MIHHGEHGGALGEVHSSAVRLWWTGSRQIAGTHRIDLCLL